MTHSGCGYEPVGRQGGRDKEGEGEKERLEGEEERNSAGKVFLRGVSGEKGRKLMVPGLFIFFFLPFPSKHFADSLPLFSSSHLKER